MAIKRYDVVAVTGTYTDRNGIEKKRYLNCGVVFETDKGLSLKLEAVPTAGDGWFMLFEPRNDEQRPQQRRGDPAKEPALAGMDFNDDIPF